MAPGQAAGHLGDLRRRTIEQLETNLAAADLELSAGHLAALDQASAADLGYLYSFIQATQSSW